MSELESVIEQKLINQLTTGDSQWSYRPDLRNETDLWNNIREKLNANNVRKLDGHLITDSEMVQIKEFIKTQAESPYKAGVWLAGENGLAQIPLVREDASLGKISLDAVNNREIAGGRSSYEVINQYESFKTDERDRNRRFDVTLLINGFPMIHIELKNQDHGVDDAFNQIHKYIGEGKFSGLFGLVQMFVMSNATDTKYIAAATHDKFNKKFLSSWVDKNNNRVDDYLGFAKQALNIPQAHLMVGRYSILDSNSKSLILLRPYQIHAIEAVKAASQNPNPDFRSGYVWHTTGSGKTITSFNVTRNLLDIPSIDKSIFLIDRKDLDQQTTINFQSYAGASGDDIAKTENTQALENALKSKDRIVIVATRQKLDCLLDKCRQALENGDESARYYKVAKKIKEKQVAFVVDECHRAVSAGMKDEICKFFDTPTKKSLWYGFTGTPIFAENKKGECGQNARTTEAQYGKLLHQYTIKEALHDGTVLNFQVEGAGFSLQELVDLAENLGLGDSFIESAERGVLEQKVLSAYRQKTGKNLYDSPEHRKKVIDYICNKSRDRFRLKAPRGEAFEAILTCSSISDAQKYYKEFKDFIAKGGVESRILRHCPDFPKIAITYSISENDESSQVNQNLMKESLDDYNKMFKTKWTLENIAGYNSELNDRLARKLGRFKVREEQLDLVIVVDRLLTGFDAPSLSALFIDRQPMSLQGIIQAFSRTNRLFTKEKHSGQIVTFQTPAMFKKAYDDALNLYSNGGSAYVKAPSYEECKERLITALGELKAFKSDPKDMEILSSTTTEELQRFAKLYQQFDKALAAIKTYEQWADAERDFLDKNAQSGIQDDADASDLGEMGAILEVTGISITKEEIDGYTGKYHNAVDEIKSRRIIEHPEKIEIDVHYELESVSQSQIDYNYLMALIQKYVPSADTDADMYAKINDPSIEKYIGGMEATNPKFGTVLRGIWEELKKNPATFKGKQVIFVIQDKVNEIIDEKIEAFCDEWCVEKTDMKYHSSVFSKQNGLNVSDWDKFIYYDAYLEKGGTCPKFAYRKKVRAEAEKFLIEEILPLRQR